MKQKGFFFFKYVCAFIHVHYRFKKQMSIRASVNVHSQLSGKFWPWDMRGHWLVPALAAELSPLTRLLILFTWGVNLKGITGIGTLAVYSETVHIISIFRNAIENSLNLVRLAKNLAYQQYNFEESIPDFKCNQIDMWSAVAEYMDKTLAFHENYMLHFPTKAIVRVVSMSKISTLF